MGTRADFYVGRGEQAEWLGSIAWDGYPDGVFAARRQDAEYIPNDITDEQSWRDHVVAFLTPRKDHTFPEQGWPWPWSDSGTTDYAYALDGGQVWGSCFGRPWFLVADGEPRDDDGERIEWENTPRAAVIFPDMSERKAVTYGSRSGVMIIGPGGLVPEAEIDAQEAGRS